MKKILLTGGGTLGSVMPLIAVFEYLRKTHLDFEFYWLGTKYGPEKKYIEKYSLPYKAIAAGKLRRFFSLKNLLDIVLIIIGFIQALSYLKKLKPNIIVSIGGFVSVPVVIAGKILNIKSLIHQQDIQPGLANKIMARFATTVTVAFPEQVKDFPKNKVAVVGNPVRSEIVKIKPLPPNTYNLKPNLPFVLIMGGGTGSKQINDLVAMSLSELTKFCQIIHVTGKNRSSWTPTSRRGIGSRDSIVPNKSGLQSENYSSFQFITDDLPALMAAADLVVSRAGMSSLTELSYLGKPTILIPMPHSHQEKNAEYFKSKNAVEVLSIDYKITQDVAIPFARMVQQLLADKKRLAELSKNINDIIPPDSTEKLAQEIVKLLK